MTIPPNAKLSAPAAPHSVRHGHLEVSGTPAKKPASLATWELVVFGIICLADMLSTAVMYVRGIADEANPMLAVWLHRSVSAFCMAKLISFVPTLIVCLIYRNKYPVLITYALRAAIAIYIIVYVVGVGVQYLPH